MNLMTSLHHIHKLDSVRSRHIISMLDETFNIHSHGADWTTKLLQRSTCQNPPLRRAQNVAASNLCILKPPLYFR